MTFYRTYLFATLILVSGCGPDQPGTKLDRKSVITADGNGTVVEDKIVWHWEDDFSEPEKEKIVKWLNTVNRSVADLFGKYHFTMHFYMKRRDNSNDPVPWAYTKRGKIQGVNFNVDPDYSLKELNADWVAPHEISHLAIPSIGNKNSWFAEGFASFMQYQVMAEMGTYTHDELDQRYVERIRKVKGYYDTDMDFIRMAGDLRARYRFPAMYWGSASYFVKMDRLLKRDYNTSMVEVIRKYQLCCRSKDRSLSEVINSWDRIVGDTVFSALLYKYKTLSGKELLTEF